RCSAVADVGAEDRLDVDDRRPVDCFEVAHSDPRSLNGGDLHAVQSDRIRTVGRARAEDTLQRPRGVSARVHTQDVATCPVKPGYDEDVVGRTKILEPLHHLRLEDQPSRRGAFVGLPGRRLDVGQCRLDTTNHLDFNPRHDLLPTSCPWIQSYWTRRNWIHDSSP